MKIALSRTLFLLFISTILSACSSQVSTLKKERYFWPPLPGTPKIEWIGSYSGGDDLSPASKNMLNKFVGVDKQETIKRPLSAASDGKGIVLVSQTGEGSAMRFDFIKKKAGVVADGGLDGVIERITGIITDELGNFYISDSGARKIHVVSANNVVTKVINVAEYVSTIGFIGYDKKNKRLIIPDPKSNKVVVTDMEGKQLFSIGTKVEVDKVYFNRPSAASVESDGTIVVCDSFNALIHRFTPAGVFINKFGTRGDSAADFALIKGVAVDSEDHIYVTDGRGSKIIIFNTKGEPLLVVGDAKGQTAGNKLYIGGFNMPQGITIDQNDRIYVADQLNNRFQIFQYMNKHYLEQNPIDGMKDTSTGTAVPLVK